MAVPYTFGTATASIPLSNLDSNFATTITLGNTAIQLGNTVTTLNNMTLANVTVSSGSVTLTNITATTANVTTANISGTTTLTNLTASTALALDASKNIASVTNTGTGNNVLATSPTITTPTISSLSSAAATALTLQSAGTTAITVDTSQNVGIGTTSPSSYGLLSVLSSTAGSAKISIQDTSTGAAAPLLQFGLNSSTGFNSSDAARVWSTGVSATVASLNFAAYNAAAPSTAQMILSAGRLIIGGANINGRVQSQTPAAYTESNYRSDSATASGTTWNHFYGTSSSNTVANIIIYGNGNIQNANNSYGALSDLKLKENIVDATPKLASLMQVKIRNYNLKSDNGTNKQIGVIAQELESIFPAMVDTTIDRDIDNNEIGTTKSVKYSVFVPMLIKAIQEQQALITALTARITALEGTPA